MDMFQVIYDIRFMFLGHYGSDIISGLVHTGICIKAFLPYTGVIKFRQHKHIDVCTGDSLYLKVQGTR